MLLIWALTLMTTVVIGNSDNSNNEETTEEHEVRVQREIDEANAIQARRIKSKTQEEYSRKRGTNCLVLWRLLRKNEVSRTTGTHKRKNIGSSSSRSQSLPRKVNKKKKNRLGQFQQFLDKCEQREISV